MSLNIAERLKSVLCQIQSEKDDSFAGIGIIVCSTHENIPMVSMRLENDEILRILSEKDLIKALKLLSNENSDFHDGFHVLNENFRLTKVAQFISPPVIEINITEDHGSRFITALFTSKISGVIATGVIGKTYLPKVFINGQEL